METKTTPLHDSTHEDIKKAKLILRNKYGINITVKDIVRCVTPGPEEIVKKVIEKINNSDNIL